MELFYKTIKRELIQGAKFKTPEQARKEIFKYIELYYNTKECILLWMIFFLSNLTNPLHKSQFLFNFTITNRENVSVIYKIITTIQCKRLWVLEK
ncbi:MULTISPECIES: IS3 family transposase [Bacillus cereus group]|uniref:IS3 family transposase n=1 Tax=Bacillus cereus group TaxID=86661 RepID=UPI0009B17B69|nr:IS3 family transposase [Bacillus thuringiensis]